MKKAMTMAFALMMLSILPIAISDNSDGAELEMKGRLAYDLYYADVPVVINNTSGLGSHNYITYNGIYEYLFFKKESENHNDFIDMFKDYATLKSLSFRDILSDPQDESDVVYVFTYDSTFSLKRSGTNFESFFDLTNKDFTLYKQSDTVRLISGQDVKFTFADNLSYVNISRSNSNFGSLTGSTQYYYGEDIINRSVTFLCASTGDYRVRSDAIVVEYSVQYDDISGTNVLFGYVGLVIGLLCIISLIILGRPQKLN